MNDKYIEVFRMKEAGWCDSDISKALEIDEIIVSSVQHIPELKEMYLYSDGALLSSCNGFVFNEAA